MDSVKIGTAAADADPGLESAGDVEVLENQFTQRRRPQTHLLDLAAVPGSRRRIALHQERGDAAVESALHAIRHCVDHASRRRRDRWR
jgi:hypothetical protein